MRSTFSFDDHVAEYEEWFEKYPMVFRSEVEAIREMLPGGEGLTGIEVGIGTGRFAEALGIKEGVDPSPQMMALAIKRGIEIVDGEGEHLPYGDHRFDFVLMNFCVSYMTDLNSAFSEAHRVLKGDGVLVVGFVDKDSALGREYIKRKPESVFYKHANFYSTERLAKELRRTGFRHLSYRQTLFGSLDEIREMQASIPGHGKGAYVIIKATKDVKAQSR